MAPKRTDTAAHRKGAIVKPDTDPQVVADRQAIRAVHDEYCLRLELDPFESWLALFTQDTVYEVFRRTLRGHDELAAMLSKAPHGVHLPGALRIDLDGDVAETVQNYAFIGDDDAASNTGWYYRTLVRGEDGWKIAQTRVKIHRIQPFGGDPATASTK